MNRRIKTALRCALPVAVVAMAFFAGSGTASANSPITRFSAIPSTSQAGGHPDVVIDVGVESRLDQNSQSACNCEDAKDITVHLPTGFIGNPGATPTCTIADFSADDCALDSIVGAVEVDVGLIVFIAPVFNLVPPPNVAGMNGFKLYALNSPSFTVLSSRTDSDYGLDAKVTSIFHGSVITFRGFKEILWGVPAEDKNDALRLDGTYGYKGSPAFGNNFCDAKGAPSGTDPASIVQPCFPIPPSASNSPLTPFLQNPTTCDAELTSSVEVLAYDGGIDTAQMPWPKGTGCSQLSFNPSLYARPTTEQSDSPAGVDVELTVPQPLSPTLPSPSELRAASVTLPAGFSFNANAADGKVACGDLQARIGTTEAAECPEFSKVGSVEIDSSALPGPLPGFVYLSEPMPGQRYRLLLAADGFGTHLKVPGTVEANPDTGQLVVSFENLPQSPLSAFRMHFFGSERGTLATPEKCGTYPVTSTFVPWSERTPTQTSTQFFTISRGPDGAPCPGDQRPFEPRFSAASSGNTAGAHSPFSLDIGRDDGDQNLSGVRVVTPPGFSASLKGVPYCPEATISQIASPLYAGFPELSGSLCPAGSQVGTAVVGAGAGSRPLHVSGKAYLAGPYKGAPLSLVVVTPAVTGPYDLGNVVVRAAISVDPLSAQVSAASDPLPQIVAGVPLRLRSIRLNVDRPGFALNPTNCDPMSVNARVSGDEGATANLHDGYQVANCQSLPYGPVTKIDFLGGVERRGHPAIHAVVTSRPGDANTKRIAVALPKGELLDNSHLSTVCTRVAFAKDDCPPESRLGEATVTTPLLDEPLRGGVYIRASNHELPDLALDLEGQLDIEAVGRVDSSNARIRTIFEGLPDVPVSRVELRLAGGRKGLVVNSDRLCGSNKRGMVKMTGQNGVSLVRRPSVGVCGSISKSRRVGRKGGRR